MTRDDSLDPLIELYERFRRDCPDGGADEARAWAAEQDALVEEPALREAFLESVRGLLEGSGSLGGLLPGAISADRGRGAPGAGGAGWSGGATTLAEGARLGRFVLEQFLGEGGQGQVWQALDGDLGRSVALKLVRPGLFDLRRLERFAREARAGGRCSHPNLVATFAHGEDGGFAWIAQELVGGAETLGDWIDRARKAERPSRDHYRTVAELVARVATGLQAAHEVGVVHRDLKPGNILLTRYGVPKVTDFGYARVKDDPFRSEQEERGGTPYYMSPEQVQDELDELDHRTDIFSLGVVLYELLTLRRPFEGDTRHQVALRILREDPISASRLRSQCPEELSVICGKAMEKRPQDRYADMGEFAADLRRHLANEPILAKPPGPLKRAVKWVRRNPAVSSAAGVGLVALGVVSALSLRLAVANSELERATAEAEAMVSFQEEQVRSVDPRMLGEHWRRSLQGPFEEQLRAEGLDEAVAARLLRAVDLADIGRRSLGDNFFGPALSVLSGNQEISPRLRARIRQSVASTLAELGLHEAALEPQQQALEERARVLGEDDPETLESTLYLASLQASLSNPEVARALGQRALVGSRRVHGEEHEATLMARLFLVDLSASLDPTREVGLELRDVAETARRALGKAHPVTQLSIGYLARHLEAHERLQEALELRKEQLEACRLGSGPGSLPELQALTELGRLERWMGKLEQAEADLREAVEGYTRRFGRGHAWSCGARGELALVLAEGERLDEAEELLRENLSLLVEATGESSPTVLTALCELATVLERQKQLDEARGLLEEALAGYRRLQGPEGRDTLTVSGRLGLLLLSLERPTEARALLELCHHVRERRFGPEDRSVLIASNNLARCLQEEGRHAEAIVRFGEVEAGLRALEDPLAVIALYNRGISASKLGEHEEAERVLRGAFEEMRDRWGAGAPRTLRALRDLHDALAAAGREEQGRALLEDFLLTAELPSDHPGLVEIRGLLDGQERD